MSWVGATGMEVRERMRMAAERVERVCDIVENDGKKRSAKDTFRTLAIVVQTARAVRI